MEGSSGWCPVHKGPWHHGNFRNAASCEQLGMTISRLDTLSLTGLAAPLGGWSQLLSMLQILAIVLAGAQCTFPDNIQQCTNLELGRVVTSKATRCDRNACNFAEMAARPRENTSALGRSAKSPARRSEEETSNKTDRSGASLAIPL